MTDMPKPINVARVLRRYTERLKALDTATLSKEQVIADLNGLVGSVMKFEEARRERKRARRLERAQ